MVQSAPIGTNPIVYSFARFYFEVVIRERLSKLCKMSCNRLLDYIANIGKFLIVSKIMR